jgi:hypothetical protein
MNLESAYCQLVFTAGRLLLTANSLWSPESNWQLAIGNVLNLHSI